MKSSKFISMFLVLVMLLTAALPFGVFAAESDPEELTILFTHDTHDYLYPTSSEESDGYLFYGGSAKRRTILKENSTENSIYVDAGDFSMGTLYQAAFSTDAFELRDMGLSGCEVTTFGNHEFDYGAQGVAAMLRAALASGDTLPEIVISNIDFSGELNPEQRDLKAAFDEYGIKEYTTVERAGYKIGFFGLEGYDSIECIQTDIPFTDYIETAQRMVEKMKADGCDIIVALSHSGTNGSGTTGEDVNLAEQVPGIDVIVSGHAHTTYDAPVTIGDTVLVSCGEYLKNVGKLTVTKKDGKLNVKGYEIIPVDETVEEDPETAARMEEYKKSIEEGYLADKGGSFDKIIAWSDFSTISVGEMYATHQEYNTGDLIADSYLYELRANGINDVDAAFVGLGTIRGSIDAGPISVADAFEICSLGVGGDGSAGHPIVEAYITGKDIKLLTELDASLGSMVSSIKMSYSGVEFMFNERRILLDRVTEVHLRRQDGSIEKIEDDKLYKVAVNMYGMNMLGMLNGLTKGVLSITPRYADGTPIENFYTSTYRTANGTEIKEWVCLKDYLESFPVGESGLPELPSIYKEAQGRKVKYSEGGLALIKNPGTATPVIPIAGGVTVLFLTLIVLGIIAIVRGIVKSIRKKKDK